MSMLPTIQPTEYPDGRTKQSFKDETDINKIIARAQVSGTISHLAKHEAQYGDFSNFDFAENLIKIAEGRTVFDELPSEIRTEFHQSPEAFFDYVNDPANKERLAELLPALAEPGRQMLDTRGNPGADASSALEESAQPITTAEVSTPAETTPPAHSEPLASPPDDS